MYAFDLMTRRSLLLSTAGLLPGREDGRQVPVPLQDRDVSLMPSPYRWLGGDAVGSPQSAVDAAGEARE